MWLADVTSPATLKLLAAAAVGVGAVTYVTHRAWIRAWLETKLNRIKSPEAECHMREGGTPQQRAEAAQAVASFKSFVNRNTVLKQMAVRIGEQGKAFTREACDFDSIMARIQEVLTSAPLYCVGTEVGVIFSIALFPAMMTADGAAFLSDNGVLAQLEALMRTWTEYLSSEQSANVLVNEEQGWLSPAALKTLQMDDYQWNPADPDGHGGFRSWNAFFTRRLRDDLTVRPLTDGTDVIVSPCDSEILAVQTVTGIDAPVWVKGWPYSLLRMFNFDETLAAYYDGCHLFQSYLAPTDYHRWMAPCAGRVEFVRRIPGTLFSTPPDLPLHEYTEENEWARWSSSVATRGLVTIIMEDGIRVALFPIGMNEVSSVIFTIAEGDHVEKGQDLGYFQYGGSTIVLLVPQKANAEKLVVGRGTRVLAGSAVFRLRPS
jgi:phosphatidylserine decarboxylase